MPDNSLNLISFAMSLIFLAIFKLLLFVIFLGKKILLDKTKEVIAHRRAVKDKKEHVFLDVILNETAEFPTEESVRVFLEWHH